MWTSPLFAYFVVGAAAMDPPHQGLWPVTLSRKSRGSNAPSAPPTLRAAAHSLRRDQSVAALSRGGPSLCGARQSVLAAALPREARAGAVHVRRRPEVTGVWLGAH